MAYAPRSFAYEPSIVVETVNGYMDLLGIDKPSNWHEFETRAEYDKIDDEVQELLNGSSMNFRSFVEKVSSDRLYECIEERLPDVEACKYNATYEVIDDMGKRGFDFNKRELAILRLGFELGLKDADFMYCRAADEYDA